MTYYSSACAQINGKLKGNIISGEVAKQIFNPEKYIVQFHLIPLDSIFESEDQLFQEKLSLSELSLLIIQKPVKNSNYICKTPSCTDFTSFLKHHRPFNIVLTPLPRQSTDALTVVTPSMYHTTILIFISFASLEISTILKAHPSGTPWFKVIHSPSIKIILFVSDGNTGQVLSTDFLCNLYCIDKQQSVLKLHDKDFMTILQDPSLFHKNNFWNGQGKKSVATLQPKTNDYFNKSLVINRHACQRYVNGKNLKLAILCESIIMIPLSLGSYHNISFQLFHILKESNEARKVMNYSGELIEGTYTFFNSDILFWLYFGLIHHETSQLKLIYCSDNKQNGSYEYFGTGRANIIWTKAFNLEMWIILLGFLLLAAYLYSYGRGPPQYLNELITLITMMITQPVKIPKGYRQYTCVCVIFSSILLTILYQDSLTSLITVPYKPITLTNLYEVIESGYKIIFLQNGDLIPPEERYFVDFHLYDIAHKINESFKGTLLPPMEFLANNGELENYAIIASETSIQQDKGYLEKVITKTKKTSKCHSVPEGFHPRSYYWIISTVNRPYLILSIQIIKQAGLDLKWDAWALWASQLFHKISQGATSGPPKPDAISVSQFSEILLLGALLQGFALLILVCEWLSEHNLYFCVVKLKAWFCQYGKSVTFFFKEQCT